MNRMGTAGRAFCFQLATLPALNVLHLFLPVPGRFYDPEAGAVLIDGHDIRTLQLRALRRQIGLVSQVRPSQISRVSGRAAAPSGDET